MAGGRACILDFIYTSCPTLCLELGDRFEQLQAAIRRDGLAARVSLCSVSFDLARDEVPELADYAARHRADPRIWRIVRPLTAPDLERLLDLFQVVVLPDGYGGFVHNAALHVVDAGGQIVAITDSIDAALARAGTLSA